MCVNILFILSEFGGKNRGLRDATFRRIQHSYQVYNDIRLKVNIT